MAGKASRHGNRTVGGFLQEESPGLIPGTWVEFSVSIFDRNYQIRSLPGVFSYDRVDPGTEMLLSKIKIRPGSKVLDVGCGFGIIGLFAATHGAGWVDFIDSNLLATASTTETLTINRVFNGLCVYK